MMTSRAARGSVELDQEDALPGAEQQLAIGDRDALAGAEHELQAVGVAVRALVVVHVHGAHAEIVVTIMCLGGRTALQEFAQVFEQQRLGFLDTDRGSGVAREDVGHALAESGLAHELGDVVGDIQELDGLVGLELQPPEP